MGFIYKVTNNINGKVYIGKTVENVKRRFLEHKWEANTDTKGRPFHSALVKYGAENFKIEILEEVNNLDLDARERYWINKCRSYIGFSDSNGYNATLGGEGTIKRDYLLISQDYLKTGNVQQTARNYGCCGETVKKACKHFNIPINNKYSGRKVIRISETNEIKRYCSIKQASEEIAQNFNCKPQTIRKRITYLLNHKPNQKAYGYYWKVLS